MTAFFAAETRRVCRESEEVAPAVRRKLLAWFRRRARALPWRRTKDPYRVWVAEVMLQQTRVDTVLPYFERFVAAFPTVHQLAAASEQEVLRLWSGLGYYRRARHLHQAAKRIVCDFEGGFPSTAAHWQELPGIGRYTAGAIASIAFGEATPVVDGNVARVLSRLFALRIGSETSVGRQTLWSAAGRLVSRRAPGNFNQALMELGSLICAPAIPVCERCPLAQLCKARAAGLQRELPVRRRKRVLPRVDVVIALLCEEGRYLFGRRRAGGMLGGLWELPGGKVSPEENHDQALHRHLRNKFGVEVVRGRRFASLEHAYSHFAITLHVYECTLTNGRPRALTHEEIRWLRPAETRDLALPASTRRIVARLTASLPRTPAP